MVGSTSASIVKNRGRGWWRASFGGLRECRERCHSGVVWKEEAVPLVPTIKLQI